jgi:hypothetical protein
MGGGVRKLLLGLAGLLVGAESLKLVRDWIAVRRGKLP